VYVVRFLFESGITLREAFCAFFYSQIRLVFSKKTFSNWLPGLDEKGDPENPSLGGKTRDISVGGGGLNDSGIQADLEGPKVELN
jgi:hypothetical protein